MVDHGLMPVFGGGVVPADDGQFKSSREEGRELGFCGKTAEVVVEGSAGGAGGRSGHRGPDVPENLESCFAWARLHHSSFEDSGSVPKCIGDDDLHPVLDGLETVCTVRRRCRLRSCTTIRSLACYMFLRGDGGR